jgi:hypothetical protein
MSRWFGKAHRLKPVSPKAKTSIRRSIPLNPRDGAEVAIPGSNRRFTYYVVYVSGTLVSRGKVGKFEDQFGGQSWIAQDCERRRDAFRLRSGRAGATRSEEGALPSAGACGEAGLFPELFPLPDAGGFVEHGVAELVGQHHNLAAMVGFVREHVGEHGASGGPGGHPTVAGELCNAAIRRCRESIRQHAQALRGAFAVSGSSLLDGAAVGVERRRRLEMRSVQSQPLETAVVKMGENGGDGPASAFLARGLGAPGARVEMREDELVHGVVARVGFEQGVANLGKRGLGLECDGSSASLLVAMSEKESSRKCPGCPRFPSPRAAPACSSDNVRGTCLLKQRKTSNSDTMLGYGNHSSAAQIVLA